MRAVALMLMWLPALLVATDWQVDRSQSRIGFVATWEKEPFEGSFSRYEPLIRFDPAAPDKAYFDVVVDVTSVDTRSRDRDEGMADPDWFHFKRFPEAYFRARGARPLADDRYALSGRLIVKGNERPLDLEVQWQPNGAGATVSGEAVVDRREFGLGEGDWKDDPSIGFEVRIRFALVLTPQG